MNSLQSLACAFAIGLSACVSSEKVNETVVQNNPTPAIVSPESIPQTLDRIIFEGNLEFNDLNNIIPKGTHHLKFYSKNGEKFLEVNYADGSIEKYFSVTEDAKWKYVEEIRGKSISLIPFESDLEKLHEVIENHSIATEEDIAKRKTLGELYAKESKGFSFKSQEHNYKLSRYLEKILRE